MRIDKFLKISRIIKRRKIAKEFLKLKKVFVNNFLVKSSYNVKINDIILIKFKNNNLKIKILNLYKNNNNFLKMYIILK